ncbi:homing endonuclease associated repeat-containing protein [Salinigranum halophilum]|uniref:homing endonuclease associated repeat-containing protein n=1 Tax=Salinigranum halophilum TaxID=2565931 RepID=UPI0010A90C7D|nr:hypothetical protein [Salinigranum halophilum]
MNDEKSSTGAGPGEWVAPAGVDLTDIEPVSPPFDETAGRRGHTDRYYFQYVVDVARVLGRPPSRREFEELSKHRAQTVARRFQNWSSLKRQVAAELRREQDD